MFLLIHSNTSKPLTLGIVKSKNIILICFCFSLSASISIAISPEFTKIESKFKEFNNNLVISNIATSSSTNSILDITHSSVYGIEKFTLTLCSSILSTHIFPLCTAIISLQIDKPNPIPVC
ncbi:hypothetical protein Trichorick_01879 (plasmid) [Candidatus Trichorickettsia mobilis]|nr:hypothetical protein Trichorick_01879 [Candidatus Trichorickettsia mobilis]